MHGIELGTLSIEALATLRDDAIALLAERVAARQRELEAEISRITGLTGSEGRAPAKSKAKYQHPENPALVWGGRGIKPRWVEEEIGKGRTLDELKAA